MANKDPNDPKTTDTNDPKATDTNDPKAKNTNDPKTANANDPKAADDGDAFDPKRLRLAQEFTGQAVKKILTRVPVRKPDRQWFIRTRPGEEWRLETAVIEVKEDRELYLVDPDIMTELLTEVVFVVLFICITRHGEVFLWPIRLPGEDGRHNEWHRSALEGARAGETRWIRVVANMAIGGYEIFEATGSLPEPEWPNISFSELLKIAFKDYFIRTVDHPVLRRLRGEV
jgi:hypothetical protein